MGSGERYDRYKEIRNKVWETLTEANVSSLPVNISAVAQARGITCMSYTQGMDIIDVCGLGELCVRNDAFSVFTDKWYIFTKDNQYEDGFYLRGRALFAQAHELGHIVMEHKMERVKVGYFTAYYTAYNREDSDSRSVTEREANSFAKRIMAPACVLWGIKAFTAQDVSGATGLPDRESSERAERVRELAQRGQFLRHDSEQKLYARFTPFIDGYNARMQ